MNPKIRKLRNELERCRKKADQLEAQMADLETRIRLAEDDEIVRRVREMSKGGASLDQIMKEIEKDQQEKEVGGDEGYCL